MDLPPLEAREEVVRRYARVLDSFGSEMGTRPLVRQTAEFFPDSFTADPSSLSRLVQRLAEHAGLADIPIDAVLVGAEMQGADSGCSTGGCASPGPAQPSSGHRVEETSSGWRINIAPGEMGHPGALACLLSTALGRIFIEETGNDDCRAEAPVEITTELVCVGLGLGLLLLQGSYIYSKSCGGPSVTQLTKLSIGQLAIACALFVQIGEHSERQTRSALGITQRAALNEAFAWANSNSRTLAALASNPASLTQGALGLTEARSWLSRVLDRGPSPALEPSAEQAMALGMSEADLSSLAAAAKARAPKAADPERDEIAALVDEALRSS